MWRARRWRKLLNLIDQLPPASRFAEAVSNDEEHVEMILAAREKYKGVEAPSGPRIFGYTGIEARLDSLIDVMQANISATIAASGNRPPRVVPQERPETAFERVAHRRRGVQHAALASRLLGKKVDD